MFECYKVLFDYRQINRLDIIYFNPNLRIVNRNSQYPSHFVYMCYQLTDRLLNNSSSLFVYMKSVDL